MSDTPIPIERQIAAVKDELRMRRHLYPTWANEGKFGMTLARAERRIAEMEAVLATLEKVREAERRAVQPELPL